MSSLQGQFNRLCNFVLNNDAASLQSVLETDDQSDALNYCPARQSPLLVLSAESNFVDVAKVLLRAKADVNRQGERSRTSLVIVAMLGHDEMVNLLLEQPEIALDLEDSRGSTALMHAAANGHASIVQRLLNVNADLNCSLIAAAGGGHCHLLQLLIEHKASVHTRDRQRNGCLHAAASKGKGDAVSFLINANATVDWVNDRGDTPLIFACFWGQLMPVRVLLAARANVNHRSADHRTALRHALMSVDCQRIVDQLLKAGANPNEPDGEGSTALLVAATKHEGLLTSLLSAKADVNHADDSGQTPLSKAVCAGIVRNVKLLLDNGAAVATKDTESARHLARRLRKNQVIALFECALCGWEGMCCYNCRQKYCAFQCDKFSDNSNNMFRPTTVDCRLHQKLAHQSVLEWTLAMSSIQLPPYVLEIIFNCSKSNPQHKDYQQRKGIDFVWIPQHSSQKINPNFVHLIIEERTHLQNIQLFISVHKSYQKKFENEE